MHYPVIRSSSADSDVGLGNGAGAAGGGRSGDVRDGVGCAVAGAGLVGTSAAAHVSS